MRTILSALVLAVCAAPAAAVAQVPPDEPAPIRAGAATQVIVVGQGVVARAPDMATLSAGVQTSDEASGAAAIAKNAAIYDRLKAAVAPFRIDPAQIRTTFYNSSYIPKPLSNPPIFQPQRPGYSVSRQIQIRITHVEDVGKVVDAAVGAGATSINNVEFGLIDRKSASKAALELALEDAASQANVIAIASRMHVGGLKLIRIGATTGYDVNKHAEPESSESAPTIIRGNASTIDLPPSTVEVQSFVTVTYYLK